MRTVTRSRPGEHALLATPRRDIATVAALAVVTTAFFVAMAMAGPRARIGRLDAHFLHLMVSIRAPWLTTIAKGFNFVGLVAVTLPIRFLIAGFLAIRLLQALHLAWEVAGLEAGRLREKSLPRLSREA